MNRIALTLTLAIGAALAASDAAAAETINVRDAVARLRADFHLPISFIEADADSAVAVPQPTTSRALIDAIVSAGLYKHEVIDGREVLRAVDRRYDVAVSGVDIRRKPRMQALRAYVELVRDRSAKLAMLRAPGILGAIGRAENAVEPFDDESVTLEASARVVEHLVQLLGKEPGLVFDVKRFTWGTQPALGVTLDRVAPLAFPAAGANRFRDSAAIAQSAGLAWREADMIKALAHPRAGVREAGIFFFGLWQRKAPADQARLRKMIADPVQSVRLLAAEALAACGDRSGLSTVTSAALHQTDRDLRIAGIRGAAAYTALPTARAGALEALKKTLADKSVDIRLATAHALTAVAGDDVRQILAAAEKQESDPAVLNVLRGARMKRSAR